MNTDQYTDDFCAWADNQAKILMNKEYDKLDIENLTEEVASLGNSEKNKLESHLAILIMHMLKTLYQPEKQTRSWELSIKNARYQAFRCLDKNPSLKHVLTDIIESAYKMARWRALDETGLYDDAIPEKCFFDINDLR